jgi:NAD(P)-dependent dehydrogenase (short-subunit alcohol dehydrogenase family)
VTSESRPLAIVTGASTGIGYELARLCRDHGFDLLIAADEPEIEQALASLRQDGVRTEAVQADLSTPEGVDKLYAATKGRKVDALLANAGRGRGRGFLDQDPADWRRVVETNITGTLLLVQKVGRDMRSAGAGRILILAACRAAGQRGDRQAIGRGEGVLRSAQALDCRANDWLAQSMPKAGQGLGMPEPLGAGIPALVVNPADAAKALSNHKMVSHRR